MSACQCIFARRIVSSLTDVFHYKIWPWSSAQNYT